MGSASATTFTDERNSVNTLISDLKIVVKEYKNAETAATSMRSKDVGTIKSIKTNELDEFIAKIQNSKVPIKEMRSEIANLKTSLSGIKDTDSLTAYLNQFDIANSKFKSLKEQFANSGSVSSVIFNPSDLERQGKIYVQRVRNTIDAIKPELESKLRNAGYADIEVKGIEDAKGKIKSLTATVTDATGVFKQLNFERGKIQGSKQINHGFIQTDDVKVIGNISSVIDKVQNNLSSLKTKWEEQGVFVGEFKTKVEQLESSLSSVGSKGELNSIKTQIQDLKNEASTLSRVNKIQLLMDNGHGASEYQNRINSIIASLEKYGVETKEAQTITTSLQSAFDNMKGLSGQELVAQADKLEQEFKAVKASVEQAKIAYDKYMQPVTNEKATSLINRINTFLSKNTKITKDARIELEGYIQELSKGVNLNRWNEISGKLKETENSMQGLHKLGSSLKNQMSQTMSNFSMLFSVSSLVMKFISQTREAVSELKEVNTILTEISKTSNLTKDQLEAVGNASFETASKYGNKASDYLLGVQEMYRAGYQNAEELAELSTLVQSAGDLDADLANDYILASDAAYRYSGNVEKLNLLLDSQNQVTNRNAVSMEELANATKVAASQLANSNISENEMTAILGTGIATTKEAGEVVGRAVKSIIMNLQQVEGETGFEGEVIDEESLKKVEARCHSVGVELEYMKDGIAHLRDPIDVLKELAEVYNSLPDDSTEKAGILSDIGGKYRSNVLSSILSNWDKYEKMLSDYENASGSAMEEAMKSVNNWEGSLNRLSNTWTDTVGNIANSDAIITIINSFNNLLNVLNKVTNSLGSLGSIGLGAGLFAGLKNVGSPKMSGLITV